MDKNQFGLMNKVNNIWNNAIAITDSFVNKQDLTNLVQYEVEYMDERATTAVSMEIYSLKRLAYNPEEGIVDKLVNVYSAMHSLGSSVFTIIHGEAGKATEFYIGCRCNQKANIARSMLKKNFEGNFPGIELEKNDVDTKNEILDRFFPLSYERKSVASLSVSADYRMNKTENNISYIQGIEKFVDTMKGQNYTAYFLAEPISKEDCRAKRQSYEDIITELSKYNKVTVAYNENDSEAVNKSLSTSVTKTITDSINHSVSTNTSVSIGKNKGHNSGHSYGFFGMGFNSGKNSGTAKTDTKGETDTEGTGRSTGQSDGSSTTEGTSTTKTHGTSMTLNVENKHISELISKLEYELKKLEQADSFGLWDTAAYMIADDEDTALIAANSIRALVIGDESGKAKSFINYWGNGSNLFHNGPVERIMEFLHYGMHPVFKKDLSVNTPQNALPGTYYFTPAVSIGGNVLPTVLGLPMKSIPGVTVIEAAEFGRNIVTDDPGDPGNRKIRLGEVLYMGKRDSTPVELYVNSLSSHTFVCGAPGSGKSNTIYKLMYGLMGLDAKPERDDGYGSVKFLVIEPAKGEYKYEFANMPKINIFTAKKDLCRMLRINPFEFPYEDMDVREHIERLKDIISACWPLTAAMPAILAESLEKAYLYCGWDLNNSVYVLPGDVKFPCFGDVLKILPKIIQSSSYSSDAKGDYTGALVTRVASLTNGIVGNIFTDCGTVEDRILFDENTIVDLSTVGSTEARSLIMGILVMKLENYRKVNATKANYPLRHVTILEEAHNLLPRCSTGQSDDSSNVQGKSVETISHAISEMRTYGEGFIIIDQSPSAVAKVAVSNTSTKIIMRLPGEEDVEAAGSSIGLTDVQKRQISMLSQGQAIVRQGNWISPVMALADKAPNTYYRRRLPSFEYDILKAFRGELIDKCIQVNLRNGKRARFAVADRDIINAFIERELDVAEHYKDFYKSKWSAYCELDAKKRHKQFPAFVMDVLAFSDGLLICSPELKEMPKTLKNPEGEYLQALKNWIDKMEEVLKAYVTGEEDLMQEIVYQICCYCKSQPPSLAYKVCATSMIQMHILKAGKK